MSVSLTPHVPIAAHNLSNDLRLQANEGDNCCTTALKVGAVFAALAVTIGAVLVFGPVAAVVVATVLVGAGLMMLFSKCCPTTPSHTHNIQPVIPWYQRFYQWIPAGNNYYMHNGHERVGGGRNDPHRGQGGHLHPHLQPSGPRGHEEVGGGQNDPNRGNNNYGHQQVGGGHGRPHGGHPLQPLQPSGPMGHQQVGSRK